MPLAKRWLQTVGDGTLRHDDARMWRWLNTLELWQAHAGYALMWLGFGLGHSLLARWWMRGERYWPQRYGLVAVVHLALVLGFGVAALGFRSAWPLPWWGQVMAWGVTIAGVVIGVAATRQIGLVSSQRPAEQALVTTGWYGWVRHPGYVGLIAVCLGLSTSHLGAATTLWVVAYILIGVRYEEQHLARTYGADWQAYCARVGCLWPRRQRSD